MTFSFWLESDGMYGSVELHGVGEYHVTTHRHTYHLITANNNLCYNKENGMSYISNVTSMKTIKANKLVTCKSSVTSVEIKHSSIM